jgi:predicted HTH transcriptional regulator
VTGPRSAEYLRGLVRELCKLPRETEWVEFKHNKAEPEDIGEYISALANAAALNGKAHGYMVWGVQDGTHDIVGTTFDPAEAKKGNQELESWLLQLLNPKLHFRFYPVVMEQGEAVVVLEIAPAFRHPVQFQGREYVRVGSYKKPLNGFPDRERALWRALERTPFEDGVAAERVSSDDVLRMLDYPAYFRLLGTNLPPGRDGILAALAEDDLIKPCEAGGWNITNLGAMLFATHLPDFPALSRKALRVIKYQGTGKMFTERELSEPRGYAASFEETLRLLNSLLPANEVMGQALRRDVPMFPELAVREVVANALIHQDFLITGSGPMVEIFDNRIEVTNPGEPLVDTRRFVDTPPKSRNETLASLMRRFNICEERGSGIDKVVFQVEFFQLPAPLFEVPPGFMRTVLFAHRPLAQMTKADRVRACYLHACLKYVSREPMTNATLRERLGISDKNAAAASRILGEAVDAQVIVIEDKEVGARVRRYLPYWASAQPPEEGVV